MDHVRLVLGSHSLIYISQGTLWLVDRLGTTCCSIIEDRQAFFVSGRASGLNVPLPQNLNFGVKSDIYAGRYNHY